MSMVIPFDTLDYARKLETAGVPAAQAEQQAKVLSEAFSRSVALALDQKIDAVETRLNHKIDTAVLELSHKIDAAVVELKGNGRLLTWMSGTAITLALAMLLLLLKQSF